MFSHVTYYFCKDIADKIFGIFKFVSTHHQVQMYL